VERIAIRNAAQLGVVAATEASKDIRKGARRAVGVPCSSAPEMLLIHIRLQLVQTEMRCSRNLPNADIAGVWWRRSVQSPRRLRPETQELGVDVRADGALE